MPANEQDQLLSSPSQRNSVSRFARAAGLLALNFGMDPRGLKASKNMPRFLRDYRAFTARGGKVAELHPILGDYDAQAGSGSGQYFHQDLLVASFVYDAAPRRHIDVGSRIDGFIAHVAAFREIEMMDIRPLEKSAHARIRFLQGDLMRHNPEWNGVADSVSSLHALEHFGLGRYGDTIDPNGHVTGFRNLSRIVAPGGMLYVGLPIGSQTQVFFNAHRIFAPSEPPNWFEEPTTFALERFDYIDDEGNLNTRADICTMPPLIHGCGIYSFRRLS